MNVCEKTVISVAICMMMVPPSEARTAGDLDSSLAAAETSQARNKGYAESIYSDFQKYSNGAVSFNVMVVSESPLASFKNMTASQLLGLPLHSIEYGESAIEVDNVHYSMPDRALLLEKGFDLELAVLEKHGYPLDQGVLRQLTVDSIIGNELRNHRAAEICWPKHGKCVLVDNAMSNIEDSVRDIRSTIAEGWGKKAASADAEFTAKGSELCVIEGTTQFAYSESRDPYSRSRTGSLGVITLWEISVPAVSARIVCGYSQGRCNATPSYSGPGDTYVNASWAGGHTVDKSKAALAIQSSTKETAALGVVTGGVHRYPGTARLSYSWTTMPNTTLARDRDGAWDGIYGNQVAFRKKCVVRD